jgi:tRNA A-37 threonylcarbamoyl transferase component Bud32
MYDREIFLKTQPMVKTEELIFQLEDPMKHILIQTSLGLVNLADKITFSEYIKKAVQGKIFDMKSEELGGVLNSVHLLTFQSNNKEQKVVLKKFKDWSGFKWFPLALWSFGTKDFAVLGRSRMEKEYEVNQFLNTHGFPVPKILYVSLQECLILKDYVEGENFVEIIKQILSAKKVSSDKAFLLRDIGRKIAEVHKLGVVLGDCKPDNIIIAKNGKPYFVDLEQATRNGNKAWDIAVFLFFSGHYVSPLSSAKVVASIAEEFIKGYLEGGGKKETIKETKSVRYTRVFSIFTPPHVIYTISNVCKEMGE